MSKVSELWSNAQQYRVPKYWIAIAALTLQWFGWVKISELVANYISHRALFPAYHFVGIYAWASIPETLKIAALLQYLLAAGAGCLCWAACVLILVKLRSAPAHSPLRGEASAPTALALVAFILTVNVGIWIDHLLFFAGLWFFTILASVVLLRNTALVSAVVNAVSKWAPWTLSLGFCCVVLIPLIAHTPTLKNDYLEIPEVSILPDGNRIDSLEFINKNRFEGLQIYDNRAGVSVSKPIADLYSVSSPENALIDLIAPPAPQRFLFSPTKFVYDRTNHRLSVHGEVSDSELHDLLDVSSDPAVSSSLKALALSSQIEEVKFKHRVPSREELDYLKENTYELASQFALGRFFYHQQYLFGPMMAASSGLDLKSVAMLYGYGSTTSFAKLMAATGPMTFNRYLSAFFSIYLAYALVAVALTHLLFKDSRYVALIAVGLVVAYLLPGYEDMLQAPGYNPVRHLFDYITVFFLFVYFRKGSWLGLVLTVFTALFSIYWSKEFGMFLALSIFVALCFFALVRSDSRIKSSTGAAAVAIGSVLVLLALNGVNAPYSLLRYSLAGVVTPETPAGLVDLVLFCMALLALLGTAVVFRYRGRFPDELAGWIGTLLALATNLLAGSVYFIWYPGASHLGPLIPGVMLLLAVLIRIARISTRNLTAEYDVLRLTTALISCVAALGALSFAVEWRVYTKSVAAHEVFNWKFPGAILRSTGDPALFQDAVSLIRKYDAEGGVVVLSRYSSVLPMLAGKYNIVGLPELESTLVSVRESDFVANTILNEKAPFIFVDNNIDEDLQWETVDAHSALGAVPGVYEEARGREQALGVLGSVFHLVLPNYHLVERGQLLSVYSLNDGVGSVSQ